MNLSNKNFRALIREALRAEERKIKIRENEEDINHLIEELCLLCENMKKRTDAGENEDEIRIAIKMISKLFADIFDVPDQVSHFLFRSDMRFKISNNVMTSIINEICTSFSLEKLDMKENDVRFDQTQALINSLNKLLFDYCFEFIECMPEIIVEAHKLNNIFISIWKNAKDKANAPDCMTFLKYHAPMNLRLLNNTQFPAIKQFADYTKISDETIVELVNDEQMISRR